MGNGNTQEQLTPVGRQRAQQRKAQQGKASKDAKKRTPKVKGSTGPVIPYTGASGTVDDSGGTDYLANGQTPGVMEPGATKRANGQYHGDDALHRGPTRSGTATSITDELFAEALAARKGQPMDNGQLDLLDSRSATALANIGQLARNMEQTGINASNRIQGYYKWLGAQMPGAQAAVTNTTNEAKAAINADYDNLKARLGQISATDAQLSAEAGVPAGAMGTASRQAMSVLEASQESVRAAALTAETQMGASSASFLTQLNQAAQSEGAALMSAAQLRAAQQANELRAKQSEMAYQFEVQRQQMQLDYANQSFNNSMQLLGYLQDERQLQLSAAGDSPTDAISKEWAEFSALTPPGQTPNPDVFATYQNLIGTPEMDRARLLAEADLTDEERQQIRTMLARHKYNVPQFDQ